MKHAGTLGVVVSSEAFCVMPFTPGPGGLTTGPLTTGCTAPPMTWSTVFTTVLVVVMPFRAR